MINVTEKRDVGDVRPLVAGSSLCRGEHAGRVKGPALASVAKEQCAPLVRCWEDDDERAEHVLASGCVLMSLEETILPY